MTPQEIKAWAESIWNAQGMADKGCGSRRNRFVMDGDHPAIVPGALVNPSPTFGLSREALKRRRSLATFSPSRKAAIMAQATISQREHERFNFKTGHNETITLPHYDFGHTPRKGSAPRK